VQIAVAIRDIVLAQTLHRRMSRTDHVQDQENVDAINRTDQGRAKAKRRQTDARMDNRLFANRK